MGWRPLKIAFHWDAPTDLVAIRPWVSALLVKDRRCCCMRLIRKKVKHSKIHYLFTKEKLAMNNLLLFYPAPLETVLHLALHIHLPMKSYTGINTVRIRAVQSSKMSQVHFKKEILKQTASLAFTICSPSVLTP